MDLLPEFLVKVNMNFFGLVAAAIIVMSICVFGIYYYYFIERAAVVGYACGYFLCSFFIEFFAANYIVAEAGRITLINPSLLFYTQQFFAYVFLFTQGSFFVYISRRKAILLRVSMGVCGGILLIADMKLNYHGYFLAIYGVIIVTVSCVFLCLGKKYITRTGFLMGMVYTIASALYYVVEIGIMKTILPHSIVGWMGNITLGIAITIYFTVRYKRILDTNEKLYQRLMVDELTEVYSKVYFEQQLELVDSGYILFIDINQFKYINDNFGHSAGDDTLIQFSKKLKSIEGNRLVPCRYGGDEFAILIKKGDIEECKKIGEMCKDMFKLVVNEKNIIWESGVGISIGISEFKKYNKENAVARADEAMYKAKERGNYQIEIEG